MADTDALIRQKEAQQLALKSRAISLKQSNKSSFRKGACKNCGAMTHKVNLMRA
jgi:hypothetical protein